MELEEIITEVESYSDANHVVLTGGEPLIHEETVPLVEELADCGYHITVETNGTIYRDAPFNLVSISPKLATSTPTPEKDPKGNGEWADRHDDRRLDVDVLSELVDTYDSQLKFVVTDDSDLPEINRIVADVREAATTTIADADVLLMPEGITREQLDARRQEIAELALEAGYRYTPRLHVDLWNDAPGT
jgi:7-carboxy-7-deazaguanine synthase